MEVTVLEDGRGLRAGERQGLQRVVGRCPRPLWDLLLELFFLHLPSIHTPAWLCPPS